MSARVTAKPRLSLPQKPRRTCPAAGRSFGAADEFVTDDDRRAKATYPEHELRMFTAGVPEVGRAGLPPTGRGSNYEPGGMVFAGGPDEIADRHLPLDELLGYTRLIPQMDR